MYRALKIVQRSEVNHGVRYIKYLGDGDYGLEHVVSQKPFGDIEIIKLECIGHVEKKSRNQVGPNETKG